MSANPPAVYRYDILYADPPWDYKGQTQHAGKGQPTTGGAAEHYPTVPLETMKAWDILSLCNDDCLLFLWTTSPHLDQAIELGKSWGFKWATVAFVWDKKRVNPGYYTMSQCELCLVFKRGRIPQPRGAMNVRQLIREERTEHSRKPITARERISRMFPSQTKLEIFARGREATADWAVWTDTFPQQVQRDPR